MGVCKASLLLEARLFPSLLTAVKPHWSAFNPGNILFHFLLKRSSSNISSCKINNALRIPFPSPPPLPPSSVHSSHITRPMHTQP